MFEDMIYREDNIVLQTIRHPLYQKMMEDARREYYKRSKGVLEGFLSKDSGSIELKKSGIISQRPSYFHAEFPKKATSLDTEEHYASVPNEFVVRWIPRDMAKLIFPALYFLDLVDELKREKSKIHTIITASPVPTTLEKEECKIAKGNAAWDRNGVWFCTCSNINLSSKDEFGPKFFKTYNQWLLWDHSIHQVIDTARETENFQLLEEIRKAKTSSLV